MRHAGPDATKPLRGDIIVDMTHSMTIDEYAQMLADRDGPVSEESIHRPAIILAGVRDGLRPWTSQ